VTDMGGTMRLGAYPCDLVAGSDVRKIYGATSISERHRHRYEVNNAYRDRLAAGGLRFCGLSPDGGLVEIIELPEHPFFVASQFHPEFNSRPTDPEPLFREFIGASVKRGAGRIEAGADAAYDEGAPGAEAGEDAEISVRRSA
jgi:CTP synthase